MDRVGALGLVCAVAGCAWLLLAAAVLVARIRGRRRGPALGAGSIDGWVLADVPPELVLAADPDAPSARAVLERGLRSEEEDLRIASITALGRLGARYEWAIDGLLEALAEGLEEPVRVVAQLDRLAPRPGPRLVPLLCHPRAEVRSYALRLLTRYPALVRRHAPDLAHDPSPHVRAAALDALRTVPCGEALRCALDLLADPHPLARSHAARTAASVGGAGAAPYLAVLLDDESWWVRNAAREALRTAGSDVGGDARALGSAGRSTQRVAP